MLFCNHLCGLIPFAMQVRRPPLVVLIVGLLLLPIIACRDDTLERRFVCHRNLREIERAIYSYYEAHGHFPPAYTVDERGRKMHSWRVLLLPYLGENDLYKQFNLHEPWDSPRNLAVSANTPAVFRCPADGDQTPHKTNYVMIVGEGTISDGPSWVEREMIEDDPANTIMIVEVTRSDIRWTEPRDLASAHITYRINAPDGQGIASCHPGGTNVLFCDGHTEFLLDSNDPQVIRGMATICGGEDVSNRISR
jgi:prepilin-type processing-associated H-X9-DG protein